MYLSLSKKLKKKMEELCGLVGLDWEARQERAEDILRSNSWKQDLCNELQGLSFRDLEQYLQSVATERQKKEEGYERKLAAYNAKETKSTAKSLRRDSSKPAGLPKPPPRTLAEILRQVYAPRVAESGGLSPEERERLGLSPSKALREDLFPDTPDADN